MKQRRLERKMKAAAKAEAIYVGDALFVNAQVLEDNVKAAIEAGIKTTNPAGRARVEGLVQLAIFLSSMRLEAKLERLQATTGKSRQEIVAQGVSSHGP